MRRSAFPAAILVLALLAACTVGPDFKKPETSLTPGWYQEERDGLTSTGPELVSWWEAFGDPKLNRLVAEAHRANNNLEIAAVRILESRAQLGIATGLRWPQSQFADAGVDYSAPAGGSGSANVNVGATVAWEIDLWGRYRRGIESAEAALLATMASYDDVLVLLTAQVVQTYTTIRLTEQQIDIARENIKIQRRSYEIVDVLHRNGDKSALDLQQAYTLLMSTESTVPSLEAAVRQAENALSTLLGRQPGDLSEFLGDDGDLPPVPQELAIGIPADLLRRRPDVRAAELNAMSLNAQVGVATAALYPSFSLTGFLGLASGGPDRSLGDLFGADSLTYGVGGGFVWPFFNYGRIRNNIRVQDARLQQALIAYRETVLQAAREVEDAMAAYVGAIAQESMLAEAVTSAQRSNELSMLRYKEGFSDYQRVLDAQQSLFAQQGRWVENQGAAVRAVIDLYKALGGGWEYDDGRYEVSPATQEQMQQRTDWGKYFETAEGEEDDAGG